MQLSVAASRDQRALVLTAFSIVSSGLVLTAFRAGGSDAFLFATILFLLGACFGAASAVPREYQGGGYSFKELEGVAESVSDKVTFVTSLAEKNDEYIASNELAEFRSINQYRISLIFFIFGVIVGIVSLLLGVGENP